MIQLSGRFLKYNIIDKNGVQFPKSATIKIPSKVFVLFNFDKSHPIGIAEVIKDEEGLLAGIDDVLGVLKDDKVGCGMEWENLYIGENDHSLMQRLSNAGTEHRKYMRMMPVYVRITAPLYW